MAISDPPMVDNTDFSWDAQGPHDHIIIIDRFLCRLWSPFCFTHAHTWRYLGLMESRLLTLKQMGFTDRFSVMSWDLCAIFGEEG